MTEREVELIITNPIYIGLGEYPPLITQKKFIDSGVQFIKKYGSERYLKNVTDNLLKYFRHKEEE